MNKLVSASFTANGEFLKALVSAMKVVDANYIEFTRNAVQVIALDPSRVMVLNARLTPPDYRCDVDSVWVLASELEGVSKKIGKKENVEVAVRDSKFYVGHFQVGNVVDEDDVPRAADDKEALANLESGTSQGFLRVAVEPFRRIVKNAEKVRIGEYLRDKFENVGFKIEGRKGAVVFYYDTDNYSIIKLQTFPDWLLDSGGNAAAVYNMEHISAMMLLGLSDAATLDVRSNRLMLINYEGRYWSVAFWLAPRDEENVETLEEILAKPEPVRSMVWHLSRNELKDFVKVIKTIAAVVYGTVRIGVQGDELLIYWQNGATCVFRMAREYFEEFDSEAPQLTVEVDISEFAGFLRDVEDLKCYVESGAVASLVFAGSGEKIAPKEFKSGNIVKVAAVPDIDGTMIFTGETKTLESIFEDALIAEDAFLVFIASAFEITAVGRNRVYYTATLPLDGFQIQNEDYVATTQLDALKNLFNQIPAKKASIGKDGIDVIVTAETTIGPLKAKLFQVEEDLTQALEVYEEYRKAPVAPPEAPTIEMGPIENIANELLEEELLKEGWFPGGMGGARTPEIALEEVKTKWDPEKYDFKVVKSFRAPRDTPYTAYTRLKKAAALLEREEFYRRFDAAMDEWLPMAIEQHKPGLAGNLHYDAPEYEAETLAKFTPEGVKEKYGAELEKQREGSWQYYSEGTPELAAHYLKRVPDVARALAYSWTVKLYNQLLGEAIAAAREEKPLLSVYTVNGVKFVEGFETETAAFEKRDEMQAKFPSENYVVVKPEVPQHKLHPFEVWLVYRGFEVPASILVKPSEEKKAKFAKGQIVLYQGGIYEVTDMELKNGIWNYELSAPGQVLYKPEATILPYPKEQRLEIANRIRDEQLRIISEPTFKGYLDTVLFDLLRQEGMSLREYLMLHPELPEPKHEYKTPAPPEEKPPLTAYSVEGATYYKSFETDEKAFEFRDKKQAEFPSENYVVVKPELPIDSTKPYEVWLMEKAAEVPTSILVKRLPAAAKPEPKFSVGEPVSYRGDIFKVLTREFDETLWVWRYKLREPPNWLMISESDLESAPKAGLTPTREYEIQEKVARAGGEEIEEFPIPEEPKQTVYVKVHVEGGVEADEKGKPKLETPEFVLMGTTYEEFEKHGSTWEANMWSRPLVGMFGVKMLEEVLNAGEVEYDAIEDNAMTWGDDWAAIREQLAQNPPPFNKYARFIIKWLPEDLMWTDSAWQAYDIYTHKYTREELSPLRKRQLQVIAKIKDLSTSGDEQELIGNIVAAGAYAEEIAAPAVEEKPVEKPTCAGGACLLPGSYERFNLPVPPTHDELLEIGWNRPIVAVYKCVDKNTNMTISEDYYCDICAAELEEGVYPGGTVFPSMYPVRTYDNTICRRLWLPGGEEKVKALRARLTKPTPEAYMILGKRAIEMADQAISEFEMRFKGLEGKVHVDYAQLFQHWDVVPPEKKAALKRIITVALEIAQERPKEATNIYFFNWLKSSESLQKIAMQLGFDPAYWEKIEEAKPAWQKGMAITAEQVEAAKEEAVAHVSNEYIPYAVLAIYKEAGPEAAMHFIKKVLRYHSYTGVNEPDVKGTETGLELQSDTADTKLITWRDLLQYLVQRGVKGEIVRPPLAPNYKPGDIIRLKASGEEFRVIAAYPHHENPAEEWLYTLEHMNAERQAEFGNSDEMAAETGFELVQKAPVKSAAELLAEEALKEMAEEALEELGGL